MAIILAGCTSGAVVYAAARGEFTFPIALAGAVAACLIAAVSTRRARTLGELLPPLPQGAFGHAVIDAPRASTVAGHAGTRSDAA